MGALGDLRCSSLFLINRIRLPGRAKEKNHVVLFVILAHFPAIYQPQMLTATFWKMKMFSFKTD